MLVDTHAHIMLSEFDADRSEVLKRASDAGVERIVVIGIDVETSEAAIRMAETFPDLYATVGIHPCSVASAGQADYDRIEEMSGHPLVVGIGETGIDLYWDASTFPRQAESFRWHIALAERTGKPVIVHDREAHEAVLSILETEKPIHAPVILHCFSGDVAMARRAADAGYCLGIGGPVTYKRASLADVIPTIPADRLLVETDAPYLPPVPFRGKRNEPAYVVHTAQTVARMRNTSFEALAEQTTRNARTLFSFS
jgi:TatD DNase family protein